MSEAAQQVEGARGFLQKLRDLGPALSPSEQKLAALVLAESQRVTRMSLAAFAAEANVSQPTAIRFCRALGCDGFPDFKIRLAQSLMVGQPFVHGEIRSGDALDAVADKIFSSSIDALQMMRAQLDLTAVEAAVSAISAARRIELFGHGLSSVTAFDANQKFMRLGVPTIHHIDSHLQRMSAATLGPGDVAIGFAYTGRVRDVVLTAKLAVERGATLIGITRSDSPLARISSIVIGVDTLENTFVFAPMTTRMAHLAVVDVLATAVAMRSGPSGLKQIRRVKNALRDQWMVGPDDGLGASDEADDRAEVGVPDKRRRARPDRSEEP
ncbi:SIS domain-containing protein [Alsobacter sp. SYSU M60028]|uniref:SIS domain-containing protein n=1 Tax=Alsobacter ponti TaxID=2962936 RepID=A0ABT1LAS5_9HYPH|nr:SIS domain-containing protein [Alsobacter ponti]